MNINEQVEYLMQGTEYGDEQLKKNMADELRSRLITCQRKDVLCAFIAVSTPVPPISTWVTPFQCERCASFRNWVTR